MRVEKAHIGLWENAKPGHCVSFSYEMQIRDLKVAPKKFCLARVRSVVKSAHSKISVVFPALLVQGVRQSECIVHELRQLSSFALLCHKSMRRKKTTARL